MSSVGVNDHKSGMNVLEDVFIFIFSNFTENSTTRHAAVYLLRHLISRLTDTSCPSYCKDCDIQKEMENMDGSI
jgi:hypothetical protein